LLAAAARLRRGGGKTVLLAESLPQRLKAAKQSKVLTAALKRCATPKLLRHPKSCRATSKCNSMEFFRNL
jgi:hypothetical protein